MPRATKAMALTVSLRLMKQPRWPATSPITAVHAPMAEIDTTKVGYPLIIAKSLLNSMFIKYFGVSLFWQLSTYVRGKKSYKQRLLR